MGTLEVRPNLRAGTPVTRVRVDAEEVEWSALEKPRAPGKVTIAWSVDRSVSDARAVEIPTCAGRGAVRVDGEAVASPDAGPLVVPLSPGEHVVSVVLTVSGYEKRIACGDAPRAGTPKNEANGLVRFTFSSPHASMGGGKAVVFVPPNHDATRPGALLVMTHPWNGSIWTYAAYAELLDEAAKRDVVLLFPSGLGNSLYTAPAEDEVLRAIDALEGALAIDKARVSIAGASMGGAGATTIGFHVPDRFASITSLFGDSKYDLSTYVHAILRDEAGAHRVNAMDVVENVRNVPVWLIHGEEDRVSAIVQSEALAQVLRQRGFTVRFDRVAGAGHEGALVARFAREIVARASELRVPTSPARVSYRSVRAEDRGAYGVTLERAHPGDAFVDVERVEGGVRMHRAENVREVTLAPGALGVRAGCAVARDAEAGDVRVVFAGAPAGQ